MISIKPKISILIILSTLVLILIGIAQQFPNKNQGSQSFDGQRAFEDIATQLSFGSRAVGSPGHDQVIDWLTLELPQLGWQTEIQTGSMLGLSIQNIVAKRGQGSPWIILGAHYDTRLISDQDSDPEKRNQPVLGANDGASGVAVLLELARVIPADYPGEIWLVFFDAEDNGNIPGLDWIMGSRYFVDQLTGKPDAVVIVDMIGDADLNIHMEQNSDPRLTAEIWGLAATLGYVDHFIPTPKYRILDDHIPFLQAEIPAVDLIDFDYPYWHSTEDTIDKISAESLKIVGETLQVWLESRE
jgi:glutaminyl-peptide cyclotransferase